MSESTTNIETKQFLDTVGLNTLWNKICNAFAPISHNHNDIYKQLQTPVEYPVNDTRPAIMFISSIKQDANGVISAAGGGYTDLYTAGVSKKPLLYSPFAVNSYIGNVTLQVSDKRLKDFKNDVVIDFDKLKQIPKKYFTWKSDDEKILNIGTSAQELENIYPELVNDYPEGDEVYKTVNYANLSIIALAAIDKLNERIEYLENKLKEYEQA